MPPISSLPLKDLAETMFMGVNLGRVAKNAPGAEATPVIHVKDIVDGEVVELDQLGRIDLPGTSQTARQCLVSTDVLVSARGTLLKCAVVPPTHLGAVASANFIVVRLGKKSVLAPELLCALLGQTSTHAQVMSSVTSSVQSALNISTLGELHIPIPPRDIQPDLVRLILVAREQCRRAVDAARLRQEEAMDIVAQHMATAHG